MKESREIKIVFPRQVTKHNGYLQRQKRDRLSLHQLARKTPEGLSSKSSSGVGWHSFTAVACVQCILEVLLSLLSTSKFKVCMYYFVLMKCL